MKVKYRDINKGQDYTLNQMRSFYERKYYGLFLNAYKFTNLNDEQRHTLLKQMWRNGTVASFIVPDTKPDVSLKNLLSNSSPNTLSVSQDMPYGLIVFVPYAVTMWNVNDFPSVVQLVNKRGATFIPQTPQIVNKDVVLGYAHTSHTPVRDMVMFYLDRIVDVEATIKTNLFAHKLPRLVICSPEDKQRVEDIMEAIERGENKLFLDVNDWQSIKNVLEAGGSYIIDKLYQYKLHLENELLSFLGINNIGIEKQERLIVDEANANNELINDSSDCFLTTLQEFCEKISDILGYPITVEANSSPASNVEKSDEKDDNISEEEDDNA